MTCVVARGCPLVMGRPGPQPKIPARPPFIIGPPPCTITGFTPAGAATCWFFRINLFFFQKNSFEEK